MSWLNKTLRRTIGQKSLIATSGILLIMFLTEHGLGSLTLLNDDGGETFNLYAADIGNSNAVMVLRRECGFRKGGSGGEYSSEKPSWGRRWEMLQRPLSSCQCEDDDRKIIRVDSFREFLADALSTNEIFKRLYISRDKKSIFVATGMFINKDFTAYTYELTETEGVHFRALDFDGSTKKMQYRILTESETFEFLSIVKDADKDRLIYLDVLDKLNLCEDLTWNINQWIDHVSERTISEKTFRSSIVNNSNSLFRHTTFEKILTMTDENRDFIRRGLRTALTKLSYTEMRDWMWTNLIVFIDDITPEQPQNDIGWVMNVGGLELVVLNWQRIFNNYPRGRTPEEYFAVTMAHEGKHIGQIKRGETDAILMEKEAYHVNADASLRFNFPVFNTAGARYVAYNLGTGREHIDKSLVKAYKGTQEQYERMRLERYGAPLWFEQNFDSSKDDSVRAYIMGQADQDQIDAVHARLMKEMPKYGNMPEGSQDITYEFQNNANNYFIEAGSEESIIFSNDKKRIVIAMGDMNQYDQVIFTYETIEISGRDIYRITKLRHGRDYRAALLTDKDIEIVINYIKKFDNNISKINIRRLTRVLSTLIQESKTK